MTPARLQTIEEIFHAALDHEPDKVNAYLDTACAGDDVLRRKVEALLTSHQQAGNFIETPAAAIALRLIEKQQANSLIGATIGHYKILERIGTGGMGEVYLALDITAGRKAALKLLPARFTEDEERLKRFQQESRAVVGLNHPNILTVYEIGEDDSTHYIASELIEGETLRQRLMRGRLELGEAVDIAIQVASALAAAHEAGIVHRDIKPENIMLRPDGYVKVLDFGIAKFAEQEVSVTMAQEEALLLVETNLGSILGTVRYMSPEQTRGALVDKSTDIWSLGVVLYEMVTGHAPFTGKTAKEVMASILKTEPPPLKNYTAQTPSELQQIVNKTLRKDRPQRYQSANEMLEALKSLRRKLEVTAELERSTAARLWLRWRQSPTALLLTLLACVLALALPLYWPRNPTRNPTPQKSIAVLPFENLSDDKQNLYFATGVQDEILSDLARIADLKVISRASTNLYKSGNPRNAREIGQQLGVTYLLEGNVQRTGNRVRINAQLIDARTDTHLWAQTYDRDVADLFAVQTDVAQKVADILQVKLSGREQQAAAKKPTENLEAYDAYLRGIVLEAQAGESYESVPKLIELHTKAVKLDPNFAQAWARLSIGHTHSYSLFDHTPKRLAEAKNALDTALRLQPDLGEAYQALGFYYYSGLHDFEGALQAYEQARQRLPNSAVLTVLISEVKRRQGKWDEAVALQERAAQLDPLNAQVWSDLGYSQVMLRRFAEARRAFERGLAIFPDNSSLIAFKVMSFHEEGDLDSARKLLERVPFAPGDSAYGAHFSQWCYDRNYQAGIKALRKVLESPESLDPMVITWCRNALGALEHWAGDEEAAKADFKRSLDELNSLRQQGNDGFRIYSRFAWCYAGLGEKAAALKAAQHAVDLAGDDTMIRPGCEFELASIQAMVGESEQAIATLARLLKTPGTTTEGELQLDPNFDRLRENPRFKQLLERTR